MKFKKKVYALTFCCLISLPVLEAMRLPNLSSQKIQPTNNKKTTMSKVATQPSQKTSLSRASSGSSTSSESPFLQPTWLTPDSTTPQLTAENLHLHQLQFQKPTTTNSIKSSSVKSGSIIETTNPFQSLWIDPAYQLSSETSSQLSDNIPTSHAYQSSPSSSQLIAQNLQKHQQQFEKSTTPTSSNFSLQISQKQPISLWNQLTTKAQQSLDFITGTTRGENEIGQYVRVKNLNGTITTTYQPGSDGKTLRIVTSVDGKKTTEILTSDNNDNYQQITNFNEKHEPTSVKLKTPDFTEHGLYENNTYLFKLKQGPEKTLSIGKEVRARHEPKIEPITSPDHPIYQRMMNFKTKQEVTSFVDGLLQSLNLLPTKDFLKAKAQLIANWQPNLSLPDFAALWNPIVQALIIQQPTPAASTLETV